jgi:hypothetical protein
MPDKSPAMQNLSTYKKVDITKHYETDESIYALNPWISNEHLESRIMDSYEEV